MSDISARYQAVAATFTARATAVAPQAWALTTPCPDWTVADLVAHVIETHQRVAATVGATGPAGVDRGGDLPAQWRDASGVISAALADEETAATLVTGMFGEQTFGSLVGGALCADTLVHSWDLARATGQDERLDPEAVRSCLGFLTPFDEPIRRPGGFAPKITPAAGADEQTMLLNFCGRAV